MKRISKILLCLICILGFTTSVSAASSSITAQKSGKKLEYVEGLEIYYNRASSYDLYVLDNDTYYTNSTTLRDPEEANDGFSYIVNNKNQISSSDKNYYITQAAILWYEDYLNGNNNNINSTIKNYITSNVNNSDCSVCYYINKLVNNAKSFDSENDYIKFNTKNVTFTKSGNYYYSNIIDIVTKNLSQTPTVSLYGEPSGATIVDKSVVKDGNGSFRIRIPMSSFNSYNDEDFEINVTGKTSNGAVYKYSNYGTDEVIYGRTYSTTSNNVEESLTVVLNGIERTNVRISVLDNDGDYISGIKYNIYSGDCSNSTCSSRNLVHTFTTKSYYTTLENVLEVGTYTLVEKTNNNYNLPSKKLFKVAETSSVQLVTVKEDDKYYEDYINTDNVTTVRIYNSIDDSTNIIKIYRYDAKLMGSFRSSVSPYEIDLSVGTYYLVDTDGTLELSFEVTASGNIYVYEGDEKVRKNSIDLDDYLLRYPTNVGNNNYNNDDNDYVDKKPNNDVIYDENGNIHIDNFDDIESIDISNKAEANVDVKIEWLSNIIDCPITSLSSTLKYIVGALILGAGLYLVVRNVKKSKNNI